MATSFGSLGKAFVDIDARTNLLEKHIRQARAQTEVAAGRMAKSFGKFDAALARSGQGVSKLRGALGGVTAAVTALGAAIGIAALGRLARDAFETADTLAKASRALGLTVEQLQELRHGAGLAGISTETLDKNMERFVKRLGEADRGTGELSKVLEQHNISLRNSDGSFRSVNDLLNEFADLIANAGSAQEKAALAAAAFGREGVKMVEVFSDGAAGLARFAAESRRLGQITQEQAEAAEAANDEWERMTTVVGTGLAQAFLAAAPQVEGLAFFMKEAAVAARQFFEELNATGLQQANFQIGGLNEQLAGLVKQREDLAAQVATFDPLGINALALRSVEDQIAAIQDQRAALIEQRSQLELVAKAQSDTKAATDLTTAAIKAQTEAAGPLKIDIRKAAGIEPSIIGPAAPRPEAFGPPEATNVDAEIARGKEITAERERQAKLVEQQIQAQADLNAQVDAFAGALGGTAAAFILGEQGFADFAKSVLRNLIALAIQAAITAAIGVALRTAYFDASAAPSTAAAASTTLGVLTALLGAGATTSAKGNVFRGGRVKRFERGGVVRRPTIFPMADGGIGLMGEAGPEAILPLTRTAGGELGVQGIGGAGGVTIMVDARGGGAGTEAAARRGAAAGVAEAWRRDPRLRDKAGVR